MITKRGGAIAAARDRGRSNKFARRPVKRQTNAPATMALLTVIDDVRGSDATGYASRRRD